MRTTNSLDSAVEIWVQKDRWEHGIERLAAYNQAHGHVNVPARFIDKDCPMRHPNGCRLGQWVWFQRIEARKGRLTDERRDRLTELGLAWEGRRAHLSRYIARLTAYANERGPAAVSYLIGSGLIIDGISVAAALRRAYRQGNLSAKQIAHVEELGFLWDATEAWFRRGVDELTAYRAADHQGSVSARYVAPSGFHLGDWCRRQKAAIAEGDVSPERLTVLESIDLG